VSHVDAPTRGDGRVEAPRAGHQLVSAAAGEHWRAGVAIEAMQPLVALGPNAPDNRIVGAVGGGHEGRAAATLRDGPDARNGRRTRGANAKGRELRAVAAEDDIGDLRGPVAGRGLPN